MPTWLTETDPPHGLTEPYAIAYSENEEITAEGRNASVVLECLWSERYAVYANIINEELEWPYDPGSEMIASGGTISPTPQIITARDGSINVYPKARITMNFSSGGGDLGGPGEETDARFVESFEPSAEFLKLNPQDTQGNYRFFWAQDNLTSEQLTEDESPSFLMIGLDYVVKYTNLRVIPEEAITFTNCVNSLEVDSPSLGITFAPQTLLFHPPKISRTVTRDVDNNTFEMDCRWSWRKNGWNKFWRSKTMDFYDIYYFKRPENEFVPFILYQPVDMSGMLP